jgi:ribosome biogenesis GTPase
VADTPGFGEVGLWEIVPGRIESCFPEFARVSGECRFRGCTHLHEPGCRIREAVEEGTIPASRYDSYRTLREEAAEAESR